jgi:hypothetical protein
MPPLVSFIVPCYNLAQFLKPCVTSILQQTYQTFEVLIMDNCSPDDTPLVATSFGDPRVKHIRHDENIGHLRNFNRGIDLSRGKYVWLLSADDMLRTPDVLARFVSVMESNPEIGYVFCRAMAIIDEREVGIPRWANPGNDDTVWNGTAFLRELIQANCIVASSVMVRAHCYRTVGLYPLDMPFACDWYLWCTFALYYDVAYLSEPMVAVRLHERSLTTSFQQADTHLCLNDELGVIWRVRRRAETAGRTSIRIACTDAFISRAVAALNPRGESSRAVSDSALSAIIHQQLLHPQLATQIQARLYCRLADEKYWRAEYSQAQRWYWCSLRLCPWSLKSWIKYMLLQLGAVGVSIRAVRSRVSPDPRSSPST